VEKKKQDSEIRFGSLAAAREEEKKGKKKIKEASDLLNLEN